MSRVLAILIFAIFATAATAHDFRALEVASTDGVVKCNSYRDWYVTTITGPCSEYKGPNRIAVGQHFFERGVDHTINIIIASHLEKDYADNDFKLKRGDWYCTAAESQADLDMEGSEGRRTWLYIPHCKPIR